MTDGEHFSFEEVQLAARNHGMPLEALRYDVTPVGLHYLLIHFDIPVVDSASWRLQIGGRVAHPFSMGLEELKARPSVTMPVTMECAGNGRARLDPRPESQPWILEAVGTAEWTGAALRPLLQEAGVDEGAVEVVFTGLDRGIDGDVEQDYERAIPVQEALRDDTLLAYEINGQPLPPQHGFPLRLVMPGWYGMTQVKWLSRITVLERPFEGYQNAQAYRIKEDEDDPGTPVTRMAPRSLIAPPGIPEFMSRRRFVHPGLHTLEGRAWSGWGPIERVEVSVDGGRSWQRALLEPALGPGAWHRWTWLWAAIAPGDYELCCRAFDSAGNSQPVEQAWNYKGYSNNEVHRVPVTIRS
jgi:DMSO/TMAO reductase YedYZ molybdopterin-dependent catalytic subunit